MQFQKIKELLVKHESGQLTEVQLSNKLQDLNSINEFGLALQKYSGKASKADFSSLFS